MLFMQRRRDLTDCICLFCVRTSAHGGCSCLHEADRPADLVVQCCRTAWWRLAVPAVQRLVFPPRSVRNNARRSASGEEVASHDLVCCCCPLGSPLRGRGTTWRRSSVGFASCWCCATYWSCPKCCSQRPRSSWPRRS